MASRIQKEDRPDSLCGWCATDWSPSCCEKSKEAKRTQARLEEEFQRWVDRPLEESARKRELRKQALVLLYRERVLSPSDARFVAKALTQNSGLRAGGEQLEALGAATVFEPGNCLGAIVTFPNKIVAITYQPAPLLVSQVRTSQSCRSGLSGDGPIMGRIP